MGFRGPDLLEQGFFPNLGDLRSVEEQLNAHQHQPQFQPHRHEGSAQPAAAESSAAFVALLLKPYNSTKIFEVAPPTKPEAPDGRHPAGASSTSSGASSAGFACGHARGADGTHVLRLSHGPERQPAVLAAAESSAAFAALYS